MQNIWIDRAIRALIWINIGTGILVTLVSPANVLVIAMVAFSNAALLYVARHIFLDLAKTREMISYLLVSKGAEPSGTKKQPVKKTPKPAQARVAPKQKSERQVSQLKERAQPKSRGAVPPRESEGFGSTERLKHEVNLPSADSSFSHGE